MREVPSPVDVPEEPGEAGERVVRPQVTPSSDDVRRRQIAALTGLGRYSDLFPDGYMEDVREGWPD